MRELIILGFILGCILPLIPSKVSKIAGGVLGAPFFFFGSMVLIMGGCVEPFSIPGRIGFFLLLACPIILLIISFPLHKFLYKKANNNINYKESNKEDPANRETAN